jgi:ADP-ribosyl-[dinitrogen reductase] hydrolase
MKEQSTPRRSRAHVRGSLLGGAVGDALGSPIEFASLATIRSLFGKAGLQDYAPEEFGRIGGITDDSQMTLFTAEGLLQSALHSPHLCGTGRTAAVIGSVRQAYLRWVHTQGAPWNRRRMGKHEGLVNVPELNVSRAPGNTCMGALWAALTTSENTAMMSKGCGGVMRIAPLGLVGALLPFRWGCQIAAITHGHPSGYLPAGFLAQLVDDLVRGHALSESIDHCIEKLVEEDGHEETLAGINRAVELARVGQGTAEEVESLGLGWEGHHALAIALFCSLRATSFSDGVLLAVNHSGDSDSTGSIAGNILGLIHGEEGIPGHWLDRLELRDLISEMADRLWSFGEQPASGVPTPSAPRPA